MAVSEAYAKINLTLDILGIREDGYHEVAMYMQTVGLHDTVSVEKNDAGTVSMTIAFEDAYEAPSELLDTGEDNLCVRAAKLMRETLSVDGGYSIALTKRIPVGAGLAGGSTDAAAVFKAINEIEGEPLSIEELCSLGAKLGADIPYCIMGGTYFASGTGTTLTPAPTCPKLPILLVKPEVSMATGAVYKAYDALTDPFHPDNDAMKVALTAGDGAAIGKAMGNSLEAVVAAVHPLIEELKNEIYSLGASGAMMSGSGSCVYGIYPSDEARDKAAEAIRKAYPDCFVCATFTV